MIVSSYRRLGSVLPACRSGKAPLGMVVIRGLSSQVLHRHNITVTRLAYIIPSATPQKSWFTTSSSSTANNKNTSSIVREKNDDEDERSKGRQQVNLLASDDDEEDECKKRRHTGILMDPAGYSARILPGGRYIIKVNKATGEGKRVLIERVFGFFWMIKDLRLTNNKPIMSNPSLIPPHKAKVIPQLHGINTLLQDDKHELVSLPDHILQKQQQHISKSSNTSNRKGVGCTLLAVSFKQFGFDMLPTWINPFQEQIAVPSKRHSTAKVINLHITLNGGLFYTYIIKPMMLKKFRSTTKVEDYDSTLLHFGSDPKEFRDALRMHNTLTGYVALLDSLGRVRWMSSGKATEEEITSLIQCAKELCSNDVEKIE
jgi:ATPase complex subunit ATP10